MRKEDKKRIAPQKITGDQRPDAYPYAVLSQHVYRGHKIQVNDTFKIGDQDWQVHQTQTGEMSYFGAIYINKEAKQVVVAHRGTDTLNALAENFWGIVLNATRTGQKLAAFQLTKTAVDYVQQAKQFGADYQLSFTGHSLGAFLAELSVFYCHRSLGYAQVSAVTFEGPGTRESFAALQSNQQQEHLDVDSLDILGYVGYPNLVNTYQHHVGSLYQLSPKPMLLKQPWWNYDPSWSTKQLHSMDAIVRDLGEPTAEPRYCLDWPIGNQRKVFFQQAKQRADGRYTLPSMEHSVQQNKVTFALDYEGHYQLDDQLTPRNSLSLIHFASAFQQFLTLFYKIRTDLLNKRQAKDALSKQWASLEVPRDIADHLMNYVLVKQNQRVMVRLIETKDRLITDFRYSVSHWIASHAKVAQQLLSLDTKGDHPLVEVLASVIAPQGEMSGTAKIIRAAVAGIYTEIPEGTPPATIDHLKALMDHLLPKLKTVSAYVIAPGAKMTGGTIQDSMVHGVEFKADSRSSTLFSEQQQRASDQANPSVWPPEHRRDDTSLKK